MMSPVIREGLAWSTATWPRKLAACLQTDPYLLLEWPICPQLAARVIFLGQPGNHPKLLPDTVPLISKLVDGRGVTSQCEMGS